MAVDKLSQAFLRTLIDNGGEANTTIIRSETGMTRGEVNHRFRKLSDMEWIKIDRADSGKGNRTPPKIAVLTDEGEKAVKTGEAGSKVLQEEPEDDVEEVTVSEDQIRDFKQEIDGVRNRLNVVVEQMNSGAIDVESSGSSDTDSIDTDRIEKIEREVARLRETVELLNETVTEYVQESGTSSEDSQSSSIDDETVQELRNQQDYLEEWMDVAQRHMIAFRIYAEEQGEDFNEFLQKAEDMQ